MHSIKKLIRKEGLYIEGTVGWPPCIITRIKVNIEDNTVYVKTYTSSITIDLDTKIGKWF